MATDDASCAVAHGDAPAEAPTRTLVAVFASLTHLQDLDQNTDVVVTDHHRVELGPPVARSPLAR